MTGGRLSLAVVLVLALSCAAFGQTVVNPTVVEFDPSADNAIVIRYDLAIYPVGNPTAVVTVSIGKPTADSDGKMRVVFTGLITQPADGTYEARVIAIGPSGQGVSDLSNQFTFQAVAPPPTCTVFGLNWTSASPTYAAGSSLVTVTGSPSYCAGGSWTATGNGTWLTVSPGGGTGSGSTTISWTENTVRASRSSAVTVAGTSVTVTQGAAPAPTCTSFAINPTSAAPISTAGSQVVTITGAPSGCASGSWTAAGDGSWLTVSAGSGSGSGSVTVSWTENVATSSRSSSATVAGHSVLVVQGAALTPPVCSYGLSPTDWTVSASGGTTSAAVAASIGDCAWTAASNSGWATVTPASGAGSSAVTITATANSGAARVATLTIAGHTYTVNQVAAACTYSLSTALLSAPAAGATSSVTVTANLGTCGWSATSTANWATVSPTSGTGSGTVTVTVAANTGNLRTATLTIGWQTVAVTQAAVGGAPPGSVTIVIIR